MKLYTIKEVCKELKICTQTFYNWIRDGKVATVKVGSSYRITQQELNRLKGE